ncbi:sugar transferase [Novosphingobium album (ex Hu et al. 2023)]|uniref:Sugar transferase n=1 Tax=Novosphingobium album (ex Hu et al. 2023) TaxID=2930093 RepID=A0ABT0B1J6_9SPHN|nr:sugar transferase [Novosphingobium album (ex Hu et al. 2023)]MCJ2178942.1 sugar transferase [Novosphingobium album (ex Hu et al. 2023)]
MWNDTHFWKGDISSISGFREAHVGMNIGRGSSFPGSFARQTDWNSHAPRPVSLWESRAWRGFDIVLATAILIAVLPFLILVAVLLFLSDPGPVFFAHRRIGYRGRYFHCLKFRTMKVDGDAILRAHLETDEEACREWETARKLRTDPRVTPVGAVMRKLSLDELPQLINVLMGDMSLVGPRPIVDDEVVHYGRHFEHYCLVRPGLTGLWQTSGRSNTSYQLRVAMDVSYIARKSLAFDAWLLCKTVPAVVFARGSY